MEGLLSLLLFADFFFFMMRFGCGSHMAHGHHEHSDKHTSGSIFDPVCGMKVSDDEGYGKLHKGRLFRFCSRKCLDEFELQPNKYIAQLAENKHQSGGHHHEA